MESSSTKLNKFLEEEDTKRRNIINDEEKDFNIHKRSSEVTAKSTLPLRPLCHTFSSMCCLHNKHNAYQNYMYTPRKDRTWPYGYKVLPSSQLTRSDSNSCERYVSESILDEIMNEMTIFVVRDLLGRGIYFQNLEKNKPNLKNSKSEIGMSQEHQGKNETNEIILNEDILQPAILDMLWEIANAAFQSCVQECHQNDFNEIIKVANLKMVDSMILEQLLHRETQEKKLWTDSEVAEQALDAMILDIVLHHHRSMLTTCNITEECQVLQEVHVNLVTDIASTLLKQLYNTSEQHYQRMVTYLVECFATYPNWVKRQVYAHLCWSILENNPLE